MFRGNPFLYLVFQKVVIVLKLFFLRKETLLAVACFVLNLGASLCGKPVDLSRADIDSLLASITVVKETHQDEYWMASDLEKTFMSLWKQTKIFISDKFTIK